MLYFILCDICRLQRSARIDALTFLRLEKHVLKQDLSATADIFFVQLFGGFLAFCAPLRHDAGKLGFFLLAQKVVPYEFKHDAVRSAELGRQKLEP